MSKNFLRFRDLKSRGLVSGWPQLKRLVDLYGFPAGKYLSANVRVWPEAQVDKWLADRPETKDELETADA